MGTILQTKRSLVRFLVRAHAWVVDLVPSWGAYRRQPINASLPLFLPPFPTSLKLKTNYDVDAVLFPSVDVLFYLALKVGVT